MIGIDDRIPCRRGGRELHHHRLSRLNRAGGLKPDADLETIGTDGDVGAVDFNFFQHLTNRAGVGIDVNEPQVAGKIGSSLYSPLRRTYCYE